MQNRKLIHPRKVVKVMEAFMNLASDLTYEVWNAPAGKKADYANALEYFKAVRTSYETSVCHMKKGSRFAANIGKFYSEDEGSEFIIYYNFKELTGQLSTFFRRDFCSRCPLGRGFADITLSLLHELGHFETYPDISLKYHRAESIKKIHKEIKKTYNVAELEKTEKGCLTLDIALNTLYFQLEDERRATDWAIEWLSDPQHRRIAKQFEKEFFACFEK